VETEIGEHDEVVARLVLEPAASNVTVRGVLDANWHAPCRRCGDAVSGPCRAEVLEVFEREPTEGDTWPLGEDRLDLEPMVRELLLLELPFAPEPGFDQVGRCVGCGRPQEDVRPVEADEAPERDPRWAALDQLRLDE
jgi:DUF177 domain-containing protein